MSWNAAPIFSTTPSASPTAAVDRSSTYIESRTSRLASVTLSSARTVNTFINVLAKVHPGIRPRVAKSGGRARSPTMSTFGPR